MQNSRPVADRNSTVHDGQVLVGLESGIYHRAAHCQRQRWSLVLLQVGH